MTTRFDTDLKTLESELQNKSDFAKIATVLQAFVLPDKPASEELIRLISTLSPLFLKSTPAYSIEANDEWRAYRKAKELFYQIIYDRVAEKRRWIREDIESAKKRGQSYKTEDEVAKIRNYLPVVICPWTTEEAYKQLQPFFKFITKELAQNPISHFDIFWEVLQEAEKPIVNAFKLWWQELELHKHVEPNFIQHLEQALTWHQRSEQLEHLTETEFYKLIDLLDNSNPVLRGVAAKCIGFIYADWLEDDEFQGEKYIPIINMLEMLYQKQREGKNVVGGFINGSCADGNLKELEEHQTLAAQNFNVKEWILKVVINSPEQEPYIPGTQAFWFYVHEYLDFDAPSVHKLIDGKRYWLAMMCATESLDYGSYKIMQPVLERLLKEAPQNIAQETQRQLNYLKENK
ncbi:MAG: hypothetical protein COA95_05000 [Methylophaga sp.]|nr:MAG: hypothetical protein COA95_05000 [Methylophaga sp.]